jgi:predicted class III extradiol MEMO1 family dioxygenase
MVFSLSYSLALNFPVPCLAQKEFNNTICGRHPIAVLLNALQALNGTAPSVYDVKFVRYAQVWPCM